jgi:20S proteasome alpha/beta subunit
MTLAIGIYAQGAIVMAADGRVTSHTPIGNALHTDDQRKLYDFGRFGIATAGFTGLGDDLLDNLRTGRLLESCADIKVAKGAVAKVIRDHMVQFTQIPLEKAWPSASLMLAGYEDDGDTPQIYCLHSAAGYQPGAFNWVGTERGGIVANALALLLMGGWNQRPTVDQAKLFAVLAIEMASHEDKDVGRPLQLATVTPDRGFTDLSAELPELEQRGQAVIGRIRQAWTWDR